MSSSFATIHNFEQQIDNFTFRRKHVPNSDHSIPSQYAEYGNDDDEVMHDQIINTVEFLEHDINTVLAQPEIASPERDSTGNVIVLDIGYELKADENEQDDFIELPGSAYLAGARLITINELYSLLLIQPARPKNKDMKSTKKRNQEARQYNYFGNNINLNWNRGKTYDKDRSNISISDEDDRNESKDSEKIAIMDTKIAFPKTTVNMT